MAFLSPPSCQMTFPLIAEVSMFRRFPSHVGRNPQKMGLITGRLVSFLFEIPVDSERLRAINDHPM